MTTEEIEKAANEFAEKHGFRVPYDGSNEFYDKVDVRASKDGFKAGVDFANKHWQEKSVEMFNKQRSCVHEWQPLWDSNSSLTSVKHLCLKCGEIQ